MRQITCRAVNCGIVRSSWSQSSIDCAAMAAWKRCRAATTGSSSAGTWILSRKRVVSLDDIVSFRYTICLPAAILAEETKYDHASPGDRALGPDEAVRRPGGAGSPHARRRA